jgi:hypothetical protein
VRSPGEALVMSVLDIVAVFTAGSTFLSER